MVRGIDTQRGSAACEAMQAAGTELGAVMSSAVSEPLWAQLVGLRGLAADDAHGRRHGLVVQHDRIRWSDLLAVLVAAAPLIERERHPTPECATLGWCAVCAAMPALGQLRAVWMTSGLTEEGVRAAAEASMRAARGGGAAAQVTGGD